MTKSYDDLQPYQQRVWCELAELRQRIADLNRFLTSTASLSHVSTLQQALLTVQLQAMLTYARVLELRTEDFERT